MNPIMEKHCKINLCKNSFLTEFVVDTRIEPEVYIDGEPIESISDIINNEIFLVHRLNGTEEITVIYKELR